MVRAKKSRSIELKDYGQYFEITSPPPGLRELLRRPRVSIVRDDSYGFVLRQSEIEYAWELESPLGTLRCFSGLKPLVIEWLERNGCEYRVRGCRISILGEPNVERLAGAGIVDEAYLEFLSLHERGVIQFNAGKVAAGHLIRQAALAWPDIKITVCVERVAELEKIENCLLGHVGFSVHTSQRFDHLDQPGRVALATLWYSTDRRLDHCHRDLVFFVDPQQLTSERFLEAACECGFARVYALVPGSPLRSPGQESIMHNVFGFEKLFIARHGYRACEINVAMLPIVGGPKFSPDCQPEAVKRKGLWRHPVRNRRIAKLAALLAGDDAAAIRIAFPELSPRIVQRPRKRIVIAVESVEHALELAAHLPSCSIVAGENCFVADLAQEQIAFFQAAAKRRNRKHARLAIATHAGLSKVGGCDVLIRADGGTTPLPSDLRLLHSREPGARLAIVDFLDRHHPTLLAWSRLRRSQYLEAGWELLGYRPVANPLQARWHNSRRPR